MKKLIVFFYFISLQNIMPAEWVEYLPFIGGFLAFIILFSVFIILISRMKKRKAIQKISNEND